MLEHGSNQPGHVAVTDHDVDPSRPQVQRHHLDKLREWDCQPTKERVCLSWFVIFRSVSRVHHQYTFGTLILLFVQPMANPNSQASKCASYCTICAPTCFVVGREQLGG